MTTQEDARPAVNGTGDNQVWRTTYSVPPDPMLRRALRYAAAGWPVFPCQPGGKVPLFPNPHPKGSAERDTCQGECGRLGHGFRDATTDPDLVRHWWAAYPTANVAIATGGDAPDVLDFDVKKGAPGGRSYERLRDAGLLTGAHSVVATWSGGWHLYYLGSDQGNASLRGHGVDLRSLGGYVLAPPSLVEGVPYRLTEWRSRFDGHARRLDFTAIRRHLDPPRPARQMQPVSGDHGALVRHVAGQQEGNRNGALFWASCRAAETGAGEDVFDELLSAAVTVGLSLRDAEKTIASARRRTGVPA
ncbi:bifunctional DNA primase/polymerase [Micromonospora sp. NPDC049033]|uniref:bifunctional DNA primase/polymerase n=1 Tax=Micromonospora sp. NPDC049033 TaxID=3155149 RepID=UPI0033E36278